MRNSQVYRPLAVSRSLQSKYLKNTRLTEFYFFRTNLDDLVLYIKTLQFLDQWIIAKYGSWDAESVCCWCVKTFRESLIPGAPIFVVYNYNFIPKSVQNFDQNSSYLSICRFGTNLTQHVANSSIFRKFYSI